MAAINGTMLKDGEDMDEEPPSRRSRLWLGYSEDNLGNTLIANRRQEQSLDTDTESNPASRIQRDEAREPYTYPDEFENLDELAAPSPLANSGGGRRRGYLEERNPTSTLTGVNGPRDDFENLDELAASSPIGNSHEERNQGYLENRNGTTTSVRGKGGFDDSKNLDKDGAQRQLGESTKGRQNGCLEDEKMTKGLRSPKHERTSKLVTEIYTISYLVFFSILGTLARLGLQALTFYPGAPVQTGLLWANVGGSLIMGFLSEDRKLFQEGWAERPRQKSKDEEKGRPSQRIPSARQKHAAVKKTLPPYIGLTTGFCGSFTSFSSFMRDSFFALSNALPVPIQHPSSAPISQTINVPRNPGYSFLAVLAVLIVTIGLSLTALQLGAHLALFLEPHTPSILHLFARRILNRAAVVLAFGCWLAALLLAIWPPDRPGGPVGNMSWTQETWRSQALFALVFAPLGCLLRFYASVHLNGLLKTFPLGTFAVNIFGSILEATFIDLERAHVGGMVGCQVLQGMSDGFCGCLTTVSTWVVELAALRLRHAYFYGAVSVGVALSLFVIITGSLQWTKGFAQPLCMS